MKIVALKPNNHAEVIALACQVLKNGGLVVYPTETTYGVGADCENPQAVAKLIAYKSKRDGKPLSIAVSDTGMANRYVQLNETAQGVYNTFLPGPVTVISKSRSFTAPGVDSITGTLGIRIPAHDFARQMIEAFGRGVTATGANASYQKRPYSIQDILNNTSRKQQGLIDLIIDAGKLPHNEPSTVIDTTLDDVRVSRFGPIGFTGKEVFLSQNEAETEGIARELISRYRSKLTYVPILIALTGEMGAGKTHFTKGVAKGLGVLEPITSPTYSLANEHPFTWENRPGLFVHVDTWKIESVNELESLKLSDFLNLKCVMVVEWADKFTDHIRELGQSAELIWVDLKTMREQDREITIYHPESKPV